MFKYLISFEDVGVGTVTNKLVKVESKTDILNEAKKAFKLTASCKVEWFDKDFEVYVTVDDETDIPDEGRGRLVVVPTTPKLSRSGERDSSFDTVILHYGTSERLGETDVIPLIPVGSTPV